MRFPVPEPLRKVADATLSVDDSEMKHRIVAAMIVGIDGEPVSPSLEEVKELLPEDLEALYQWAYRSGVRR